MVKKLSERPVHKTISIALAKPMDFLSLVLLFSVKSLFYPYKIFYVPKPYSAKLSNPVIYKINYSELKRKYYLSITHCFAGLYIKYIISFYAGIRKNRHRYFRI